MHFAFMDTIIPSTHFMPKPKSKREGFMDILVSISGYFVIKRTGLADLLTGSMRQLAHAHAHKIQGASLPACRALTCMCTCPCTCTCIYPCVHVSGGCWHCAPMFTKEKAMSKLLWTLTPAKALKIVLWWWANLGSYEQPIQVSLVYVLMIHMIKFCF